jgi:hypothetical protein
LFRALGKALCRAKIKQDAARDRVLEVAIWDDTPIAELAESLRRVEDMQTGKIRGLTEAEFQAQVDRDGQEARPTEARQTTPEMWRCRKVERHTNTGSAGLALRPKLGFRGFQPESSVEAGQVEATAPNALRA